MAVPMGRRRQHDHDLPPHMHRKVRGGVTRYYYGRQSVALGASFPAALRRYAELHGAEPIAGQFSEAAALYVREELPRKATGAYDLPAGIYVDLLRLTQERAATLDGLAGRLREAGAPADAR